MIFFFKKKKRNSYTGWYRRMQFQLSFTLASEAGFTRKNWRAMYNVTVRKKKGNDRIYKSGSYVRWAFSREFIKIDQYR